MKKEAIKTLREEIEAIDPTGGQKYTDKPTRDSYAATRIKKAVQDEMSKALKKAFAEATANVDKIVQSILSETHD